MNTTQAWRRVTGVLGWTRSSYFMLSAFLATILVIIVVWWPLVEANLAYIDPTRPLWAQLDWLLLGNFVAMSLLIMAGADLKADALIVLVGLSGGLAIEGWGTQTELWVYYTVERPPLWIMARCGLGFERQGRAGRALHRLGRAQPGTAGWQVAGQRLRRHLAHFGGLVVGAPVPVHAGDGGQDRRLLRCALGHLELPTEHLQQPLRVA